MCKHIKIDSDIPTISNTLNDIFNKHSNFAFISFIQGEFGCRALIYKSIVTDFVKKQKKLNNIVVGICFKGNTYALKELCDILIELNSVYFTKDHYNGSDGCHQFYISGGYYDEYEDLIQSYNFENIFYTTGCDGTRLFDSRKNFIFMNQGIKKIFGLIEGNPLVYDTEYFTTYVNLAYENLKLENKIYKTEKQNKIMLHIRNTNKHPYRNLPEQIYETLFSYCMMNSKHLYVCLDFIPVEIPTNEYIHKCEITENGILLMDNVLKICSNCDLFVGSDSGFTEICDMYTNTHVIYSGKSEIAKKINPNPIINTKEDLVSFLNNFYT